MNKIKIYEEIIHKNSAPTYTCIKMLEFVPYDDGFDYIKYKYHEIKWTLEE